MQGDAHARHSKDVLSFCACGSRLPEFLDNTTDSAMAAVIRDSEEGMDPTGLTAAEIDAVIHYVRKLGEIWATSN